MRLDLTRIAFAVTLTGALASSASSAQAYCRTTTKSVDPSFVPTPDTPCWTEGLPLFWKNRCVGYSMQKDASKSIAFDAAAGPDDLLRRGFGRLVPFPDFLGFAAHEYSRLVRTMNFAVKQVDLPAGF